MVKQILKESEDKMHKAIEALRAELTKIRTGKATTALLDGVKVDYYGSIVPLQQAATVGVSDAHTITVQPWDKGLIPVIDKAILAANLGLNPVSDGTIIRVPIPPLNEERRKELVKLVKKFTEDGKIAIRNIRRDCLEHLKKAEKQEHFSEDERKRGELEAQKLTDKSIKEMDVLFGLKEKEIMEV